MKNCNICELPMGSRDACVESTGICLSCTNMLHLGNLPVRKKMGDGTLGRLEWLEERQDRKQEPPGIRDEEVWLRAWEATINRTFPVVNLKEVECSSYEKADECLSEFKKRFRP